MTTVGNDGAGLGTGVQGVIAQILFCCLTIQLVRSAQCNENAILTEGFEDAQDAPDVLAGWTVSGGNLFLDHLIAYKDKRSLKLIGTALPDGVEATRSLTVGNATKVTVSMYIKGDNITVAPDGEHGLRIWLGWTNVGGTEGVVEIGDRPLVGTFDWRRVEDTVHLPEDVSTARLAIGLGEGQTGIAWVDELVVKSS